MNLRLIFIALIFKSVLFNMIHAQHYIGFNAGYSTASFVDFTNDNNYESKYRFKSGVAISSFYEAKIDSNVNFRIELQYNYQQSDLEVRNNVGKGSFYKNLDFSSHLMNLHFAPSFRLINKKSLRMSFSPGLVVSYNMYTHSKGNGWDYVHKTFIDSSGNEMSFVTTQDWEKNERNSNDLARFNVGVVFGLNFLVPVNQKIDFLIQNNYRLLLTRAIQMPYHTSMLIGDLSIGLRYRLDRKVSKE